MPCLVLTAQAARAQELPAPRVEVDLAQQLANPISNLVSVPFQSNFDFGGGVRQHGSQYTLNIQPVIPFKLSEQWNLISRTIVPITQLNHVQPQNVGGLGDTVQSLFLSPSKPVAGLIVGFGPVFLLPTATDDRLSANQWAAGPTIVVLKQAGPLTVGVLANHLWGVGRIGHNGQGGDAALGLEGFTDPTPRGRSARVNATFLQPFATYTFPSKTTIGLAAEATYDWTGRRWSVPIEPTVSQLVKLGSRIISVGLTGKYYAVQPIGAPGWGVRMTLTLLFPKGT